MNRRKPQGLDDELPPPEGIAPYAGARIPATIQAFVDEGSPDAGVHRPAATAEAPVDAALNVPFAVGDNLYRVRRVDAGRGFALNEVAVAPDEAVAIIERAISRHRNNENLLRLLETAVAQLAGLHQDGIYVLFWLRPESRRETVVTPPPRTPTPRPPVLPEPPPIEEAMMPVLQATALKNAAASGAPFCEECARAAAARRGSSTAA